MPERCPVCDGLVIHPEGEVAYYCGNPACPAKTGQRVGHFVSRGGMDIEGVGWALVTQLQEKGLISDPADLFFLTKEQLIELDRFAEKSATNIYERIQAAKDRPLARILLALGIRHVGETTADDLARWLATRLPNNADLGAVFEMLRNASVEELQSIEGVGAVVAESIQEYFARPEERPFLDKLVRAGIRPRMPPPRGPRPAPVAQGPTAPEIPLPPEPQSIDQTGLTLGFLSDLALKTLYLRGQMTLAEIASSLGLPIANIADRIMDFLKSERLVE